MKIGLIGHLKFPIAKPYAGGLESFTHTFLEALLQLGHDVTLFCSGDSNTQLPISAIVPRSTMAESQRRFGRANHQWIEAVEDAAYEQLMENLQTSDFDIIHNHSLSPIPLKHASRLPSGLITTLHVPVLPRLEAQLRTTSWEQCGRFVNISNENAKAWSHLLPSQTIIYNGVDTALWRGIEQLRQPRAVWFGRILADKGTHHAIAAAHLANLSIDIVGPIVDRDYYEHSVRPQLQPGDVYHGHASHDQLASIVGQAAVTLVTPCWDEPFGLVVAESLACGTPVAGFARGALPELVTPSVGRLAYPGDVVGLARAIEDCLELNSADCYRAAEERFGFAQMMDAYESLYQKSVVEVAA